MKKAKALPWPQLTKADSISLVTVDSHGNPWETCCLHKYIYIFFDKEKEMNTFEVGGIKCQIRQFTIKR